MKLLLSTLIFFSLSWGGYQVGDRFDITHLYNQHDQNRSIEESSKVVVVFDKPQYYDTNKFLGTQPNFFKEHQIAYINDISAVPSSVLSLFIKPSMQKKPFDILLLRDLKQSKKLNYQDNKITLYTLKKGKIIKIEYIDSLKIKSHLAK